MASIGSKFNAQDHDTEQTDYSPLPVGVYRLEVIESDVVPTKAGTGTLLKLTYQVVEPSEFENRRIWANINLENANTTAQEIGQRELASLCRALELSDIEDSEQLHFKSFVAKLGMEKAREGYEPRNKITRFYFPDAGDAPDVGIDATQPPKAANDNRAAANDNQRPAPAAAAAGGQKSRPWGKR